jgi:hypothetical protein
VRRFRRSGDPQEIPAEGRIVMQANEIPVLQPQDLLLDVRGGV